MPRYCIILNNKIINCTNADSIEDAELLFPNLEVREQNDEFPYGPGMIFDGTIWKKDPAIWVDAEEN
jgi:hypothetical protein